MKKLSSPEIRESFLEFFSKRGHQIVPSASLVPAGDDTLLFTNAGMNQFKEIFAGRESRSYRRACSSQKCVRAGGKHNDLENVGYTARHHTFFEMLGNFSFGDYFKKEAIEYSWELLLDVWGLPVERLWFTVYTDDDEAAEFWRAAGAPENRILRFGDKDNFWSMGEIGPCGPCSEIHFDLGPDPHAPGRAGLVNGEGDDIVEIWNLVFMQYDRNAEGKLNPLPHPSIDTGAGLERLAMVMQGGESNYETDVFHPLLEAVSALVQRPYDSSDESAPAYRVIADHLRAATFLMSDGIVPSNEGRGYVLRRIIRRALRYGRKLGLDGAFLYTLMPALITQMGDLYPEIVEQQEVVRTRLRQEEERFARTLNAGTDVAQKELEKIKREGRGVVPGRLAFDLYQTHGIPVDLVEEFAQEEGLRLDREAYERALSEEKARGKASWKAGKGGAMEAVYGGLAARGLKTAFIGYERLEVTAEVLALIDESGEVENMGATGELLLSETVFYPESGGQVGDRGLLSWDQGSARVLDTFKIPGNLILHRIELSSGHLRVGDRIHAAVDADKRRDTQRNHTATHLIHGALHEVLGKAAQQAGSLVGPDHLRFDFNWDSGLDWEKLRELETRVNEEILKNEEVQKRIMSFDEAKELGAMALFGEKYGDEVRVVSVGDGRFSRELCGGCHVDRTGDIGLCLLLSERGVAAGVRRIEAVTGHAALRHIQAKFQGEMELGARYQTSFENLPDLLSRREERISELVQEVRKLKHELASGAGGEEAAPIEVNGLRLLCRNVPEMETADLRNLADSMRQALGSGVLVLGMKSGAKATLMVAVTEDLLPRVEAGALVKELAPIVGGRGGGRPNLAQAGGPDVEKISEALRRAPEILRALLAGEAPSENSTGKG